MIIYEYFYVMYCVKHVELFKILVKVHSFKKNEKKRKLIIIIKKHN